MQNFSLTLLVLAFSPLAVTAYVECVGNRIYTTNSTYEANLRRLKAILTAENSSFPGLQAYRAAGYWPNRVQAVSYCLHDGIGSYSSCAACMAGAFQEAERACPYHKEVVITEGNCSLRLGDFRIFLNNVVFAIGFGWLFFLLLQEWRDRRRGSMKRYSSVPSGDP